MSEVCRTRTGALTLAIALGMMGCQNDLLEASQTARTAADGGQAGEAAVSRQTSPDTRTAAPAVVSDGLVPAQRVCPSQATVVPDGQCKSSLPGVYAVATTLDAWWQDEQNPDEPSFDPGRGEIRVWTMLALGEFCADGKANVVMQLCGLDLPALYVDASDRTLQFMLPETLWDQPHMPVAASVASVTRFDAAGELRLEPATATLGITLPDDAGWPNYNQTTFVTCAQGSGNLCFPDQDGDRAPGITMRLQLSGMAPEPVYASGHDFSYAPAPTEPAPAQHDAGAATLYLGLRTRLSLAHVIGSDCHASVGVAQANDVYLRVLDCAMADGSPCSPSSAGFVDRNMPVFHALADGAAPPPSWQHATSEADARLDRRPSRGARSTAVWLTNGDARSCADVRAALSDNRRPQPGE
ncbi:MAG: hypothetical protein RL701_3450 [Pseudomonadota bacterium]